MNIAINLLTQIDDSIKKTKKLFSEFKKEHENLYEQLSNCDLEISDLEHVLECRKQFRLTAPKIMKISMKISELRIKRREIKDEIARMDKIRDILINKLDNKVNVIYVSTTVKNDLNNQIKSQESFYYNPKTKILDEIGIN